MASSSSSITSLSSTLPSGLTFLLNNVSSLIPIKLDSTNYIIWKTLMQNTFRANQLFGYIDGSIPCPPLEIINSSGDQLANPLYLQWIIIDNHLLSCITATLTPSILPHVVGFSHAFEVWFALAQRHSSLSRSHIHELKLKLMNIKKDTTMEAYLDQIKQYVDRLASAGTPIPTEDIVLYTLNGLPSEYASFKTSIRTKSEPISVTDLNSLLGSEEIHLAMKNSSTPSFDNIVAFTASRRNGPQGGRSSNSPSQFSNNHP
uniref:Putative retrovirus-related Pol polyprotein n=1 Tax=Davidia involucrata TaxID=16924 RepID=A0A5B7CDP5_DAVIN